MVALRWDLPQDEREKDEVLEKESCEDGLYQNFSDITMNLTCD